MTENKTPFNDYQRIDPDDFENYEEQFVEKGGGGGKTSGHKGKKTIQALKKQQRNQSVEQRRKDIEKSIKQVLNHIPGADNEDIHQKNLLRYCAWIEANINDLTDTGPADFVITSSKSGGPGGQNVNKRETKVMIIHKPTNIRVENDQTRSQMQNRNLAIEILQERLRGHLRLWSDYLSPDQRITVELVNLLLAQP